MQGRMLGRGKQQKTAITSLAKIWIKLKLEQE
jgi:hypothetical protein